MSEQTVHPSKDTLTAYNRGLLSLDEVVAIETHISDCDSCCETIVDLSSDDTYVAQLKEARHLPIDRGRGADGRIANPTSSSQNIPPELAAHPRYEIVRLIGKGGMGDVYEAIHRKMERRVALKVISRDLFQKTEAVNRFHREVKAAAQLSHPGIVTAFDADQANDFHFMVMEFVDGVDLSQIVKNHGALSVADACNYIRQAAVGLQHAHERGMVHRDIKPHNLMVTDDGTVKILDFGLASLSPASSTETDSSNARGDLTQAGAIMGTPDFISPEQAHDPREVDIRSDIYSLGASLYFLLSGQPPFADGSVMHKLKSHAQVEPNSLATLRDDVPEELAAIVSTMMAKDPNERYLTPSEVANALESFLQTWRPGNAQSQTKEPAAGGGISGSSEQNTSAGNKNPDWLLLIARLLFAIAFTPIALTCWELWSSDAARIEAAGHRTWTCTLIAFFFSVSSGVVWGIHGYRSHQPGNQRRSRLATPETLLIAAILSAAVCFLFAQSRTDTTYSIMAGGAGVDGEGWYFSSGSKYLTHDEPGVLFGMYETPSGGRGFSYVVLLRHSGSESADVSTTSNAGLRFDGRAASIRDGITIDGKGLELDLEILVSKAQIDSTTMAVDGKDTDPSLGRVFVVDVTSDRAIWSQLDADISLDLPSPQAVVSDTNLVSRLSRQITEHLTQNNTSVRDFLAGRMPMPQGVDAPAGMDLRPNVNVASYSAVDGHRWQLTAQKVDAIRIRLLHIARGTLEVASENVLRNNGDETCTINLTLSQTTVDDGSDPNAMTTLDVASDNMHFSRSKSKALKFAGSFHNAVVVTSGDLAWDQPSLIYHIADWSGDLQYGRNADSMIEASRGNARFIALEVEWVAVGEETVPEWLSLEGDSKDIVPATNESGQAGTGLWVPSEDYESTNATLQAINSLVTRVEHAELPDWADTPDARLSYVNGELKKALAAQIGERLGQLQAGSPDDNRQAINELQGLFLKLKPLLNATESTYQAYTNIAAAAWPLVLKGYPSEFNDALVALTEPYPGIRANDRLAEADKPTEPLGLVLQAVHALALARKGDLERALRENNLFARKLEVNRQKSRLPDLPVSFLNIERTPGSLQQQALLQEALILACNGKVAEAVELSATAGNVETKNSTPDDHAAIQDVLAGIAGVLNAGSGAGETGNQGAQLDNFRIQGNWRVIFAEDSGRASAPQTLRDIRMAITADTMTMDFGGRKVVSTYTLDPATTPKSIDMTTQGRTTKAIYDLQGDTLRICSSEGTGERPTAFDSQPDSVNDVVMTLKRVKPGEPINGEIEESGHDGPLSEGIARALIPEAASISNEDFQTLQINPSGQSIENKSLSLVVMGLNIRDQSSENAGDFRFLVEGFPKPSELAAAMSLSRSKGYFSIIQPDYITECNITDSTDDIAQGKVTFNAPQLYVGSVTFEARKHQDKWRIVKFQLPSRQVSVALGDDGIWRHELKSQE